MVFIDGTWLYANLRTLGDDFQVDYGKLPHVVGNQIAKKLGDKNVDIVRIFLFGSNATNFLDADKEMVKRRRVFYDVLREEYNYEVEVYLERIENALGEAVLSRDKARREEAWTRLEEQSTKNLMTGA